MGRQPRKSFADEVRELRQQPRPRPVDVPMHLDFSADRFRGPGGVIWERIGDVLEPSVARQLVLDGALVAWDPCGCGGGCGLTWLDDDARQRLGQATPDVRPSKRYEGALVRWQNAEDRNLLVVQWPVQWGDEFA